MMIAGSFSRASLDRPCRAGLCDRMKRGQLHHSCNHKPLDPLSGSTHGPDPIQGARECCLTGSIPSPGGQSALQQIP